jgi:serine/threonine protein kinase
MLDVLDTIRREVVPEGNGPWHTLIDELLTGELSEDEFVAEVSDAKDDMQDAPWGAVAALDQRFRRGQVPAALYRSLEAKISRRELKDRPRGNTIKLRTYRFTPPAKVASTCTTPQAHRFVGPSLQDSQPVPRIIEPGRILRDRYVLEDALGSGGMGTVYKALDRYRADLRDEGRHVAVKILHDSVDGDDMTRLRREFFCAQALSHPNIVKVYELDRDDDVAFFTMELLEGRLLSALISEAHPRAVSRTLAWAVIRDVGAALVYAHSRRVVHGDLKPQNIMVTDEGEVRILDFGASSDPRRDRGDAPAEHSSELTPAYACSELLQGKAAEPADDLYALACIAYELLSGAHPFGGRSATDAIELGLMPTQPPTLTDRQWRALRRGLAGNREDRTPSVLEWIADMMPLPVGLALPAPAKTPEVIPPMRAEAPVPAAAPQAKAPEAAEVEVAVAPQVKAAAASSPIEVFVAAPQTDAASAKAKPGWKRKAAWKRKTAWKQKAAATKQSRAVPAPRAPEAAVFAANALEKDAIVSSPTVAQIPGAALPKTEALDSAPLPSPTALPVALNSRVSPTTAVAASSLPVWVLPRPASERSPRLTNSTLMFALLACAALWAAIAPPWNNAVQPRVRSGPVEVLTAMTPLPAAVDPPVPAQVPVQPAPAAEQGAAMPAPKRLRFSAESYRVYAGQRFAELHIVRSPGWDDDANFLWWTEGGTARPGVDYIPQKAAVQFLSKSQRRTSLFVRVPAADEHGGRRTFYVAMSDPHGRSIGGVVRALVTIP